MATDIATLRMTADSAGIVKGNQALTALGNTAANTDAKVTKATTAMTKGMRGVGSGAGAAAGGMRNLGLQLNQVAQVGGLTGQWAQALAVQLPDMLLGFGGVGIAAGIAAGAMIPFIGQLMDAEDEAKNLEDAFDELARSFAAVEAATDRLDRGFFDLRALYGQNAEQARELLTVQRQIAQLDAADALGRVSDAVTDFFGKIELTRLNRRGDVISEYINPRALAEIEEALSLTAREAKSLGVALLDMQRADGMAQTAEAARRVQAEFVLATGGLQNMTAEQRVFYNDLVKAGLAAYDLAHTDTASGLREASAQASALADELSRAVTNAQGLAASGLDALAASEIRLKYRGDPVGEAGALAGLRFDQQTQIEGFLDPTIARGLEDQRAAAVAAAEATAANNAALAEWRRQQNVTTTRTGGGISAEQLAAARIFENTRTALEKYNAEVAELNSLHAAGLIDAETHNRAVDLASEKYANLSHEVKDATEAMANSFAGATLSIVKGTESAEEAILRLIEQMVAMPLLERGFQTILGGIGLNFGGFRASGGPVDPSKGYVVGEKGPEWFQPNTAGSIIPNGATQNVHVSVGVDGDGNIKPFVDQRAGLQVARAAPDIMGAQDRKLKDSLSKFTARRG